MQVLSTLIGKVNTERTILITGVGGDVGTRSVHTQSAGDDREVLWRTNECQPGSCASKRLDDELEVWRTRSLGEAVYFYLDARYEKVRDVKVIYIFIFAVWEK